jgi:hypothetical protein
VTAPRRNNKTQLQAHEALTRAKLAAAAAEASQDSAANCFQTNTGAARTAVGGFCGHGAKKKHEDSRRFCCEVGEKRGKKEKEEKNKSMETTRVTVDRPTSSGAQARI